MLLCPRLYLHKHKIGSYATGRLKSCPSAAEITVSQRGGSADGWKSPNLRRREGFCALNYTLNMFRSDFSGSSSPQLHPTSSVCKKFGHLVSFTNSWSLKKLCYYHSLLIINTNITKPPISYETLCMYVCVEVSVFVFASSDPVKLHDDSAVVDESDCGLQRNT